MITIVTTLAVYTKEGIIPLSPPSTTELIRPNRNKNKMEQQ